MKTFRIDKRDFAERYIITPQNCYQNKLNDLRRSVEDILEENRPENKPARNSVLMLFDNFDAAKHFWTIQTGSKFYQTQISEEEILHIGDMNKVEEIFHNISDTDKANQIAIEYWEGLMTSNPKREIFVMNAVVENIKSNSEVERKNALAIRVGLMSNPRVRIVTEN